ncbi:hypothetical protein [Bradyrhizobium arachidis]|uniref:Uncharacterized protein n=1 Tax=Bradyrhizobium arachidis TaxID=858423 RepID=A0AAE7NUZ6_9BRAD|nr:hypothetical protein [Bradyrhizobium arachidis]QOZ72509.1 hypothetical protein WN72_44130 [Bradyrhizobium arachidis]
MMRSLFAPVMVATIAVAALAKAQPRSAFPPEIIAAPMAPDCTGEFSALKEEVGQRAQLLKAAAVRHAQPNEACKLIGDFSRAEVKLIKYLETHAAECRALARYTEQLLSNHSKTAATQIKTCTLAQQKQAPAGPTGDFWPSSVALPPQGLSKPADPRDIWMTPQSPFVR